MSLYKGDMNSRILAGEKMEDVLKNPDAPKIDWVELGKNVNNSSVGIPIAVKPTSEAVKQQNLNLAIRQDVMTQEDKIYEMFGIKKTDGSGWGLQSRPVGRLLVAIILVAGYFAYKKFKK